MRNKKLPENPSSLKLYDRFKKLKKKINKLNIIHTPNLLFK